MMCYPRVHHAAGVHVLQFGENLEHGLHANSKCSSAGMKVVTILTFAAITFKLFKPSRCLRSRQTFTM